MAKKEQGQHKDIKHIIAEHVLQHFCLQLTDNNKHIRTVVRCVELMLSWLQIILIVVTYF